MFKTTKRPALVAGMMLAALLSQPTEARGKAYDGEVRSCVAAVNDRVNLDDAKRVRHVVNLLRSTGIGRVLEIETSVFTPSAVRTYSAYCVATSNAPPVKFRISETTL